MLLCFVTINIKAQQIDIEGLNKKELKEYVNSLIEDYDKIIATTNASNKEEINKLRTEYKTRLDSSNARISRLNKSLTDNKNKLINYKDTLLKIDRDNALLKDSLKNVQFDLASQISYSTPKEYDPNDFLNRLQFESSQIKDNTYGLVLNKLILSSPTVLLNGAGEYQHREKSFGEQYPLIVPELLDASLFTFWESKGNLEMGQYEKIDKIIVKGNSTLFDSKFPKIEFLKNKMITFKYPDGSDESFLFKVIDLIPSITNNERKVLQLELSAQNIESKADIVLRFYFIGSECYLVLTERQLLRFRVPVQHSRYIPTTFGDINHSHRYIYASENGYSGIPQQTTNKCMFISRNKDQFIPSGVFLYPKEVLFLFKLK